GPCSPRISVGVLIRPSRPGAALSSIPPFASVGSRKLRTGARVLESSRYGRERGVPEARQRVPRRHLRQGGGGAGPADDARRHRAGGRSPGAARGRPRRARAARTAASGGGGRRLSARGCATRGTGRAGIDPPATQETATCSLLRLVGRPTCRDRTPDVFGGRSRRGGATDRARP